MSSKNEKFVPSSHSPVKEILGRKSQMFFLVIGIGALYFFYEFCHQSVMIRAWMR